MKAVRAGATSCGLAPAWRAADNVAMCLSALAWNHDPRWRLLLIGNRDEFHARPTAPLARWAPAPGGAQVLAGRDLASGGTWLGIDDRGRCAVVTNVRAPGAEPRTDTSRGSLPLGFLLGTDTAHGYAAGLLPQAPRYSPFNLLLADRTQCSYMGNHPTPSARGLEPGIHGISNGGLDLPWPKTRRLCGALQAWIASRSEDTAPLWSALADDTVASDEELPDTGVGLELERLLSPAFIRGPSYGTRASTIVAIDQQGHGWISERRFGPDGVFEGETTLNMEG